MQEQFDGQKKPVRMNKLFFGIFDAFGARGCSTTTNQFEVMKTKIFLTKNTFEVFLGRMLWIKVENCEKNSIS
jgi:hypothetical protein